MMIQLAEVQEGAMPSFQPRARCEGYPSLIVTALRRGKSLDQNSLDMAKGASLSLYMRCGAYGTSLTIGGSFGACLPPLALVPAVLP